MKIHSTPGYPRRILRTGFCSLLLMLSVQILEATPIKVFLLGGQSNMRGRASTNGLPAALANPQEDVLICRGSTGTVGTALEFLQPNNVALDGNTFGPDLAFGRTIADLYPDVDFALLKYAYGGTALVESTTGDNWAYNPDGGSYLKFQETVANGLALLVDAGYEPEIVGMLWHQGESNAGNSQAEYESRLTDFIADVRSLYGADLPFMIGGIRIPDDTPGAANIVAAQQAVASADPFAAFVPVDDLTTGDRWHFDQASMITLGQRFATHYNAGFSNLIEDTSSDFTAPTPAQMTWASPPAPISSSAISMTAVAASDEHGVQYRFTRYRAGEVEATSDWQDSPSYADSGLLPSTTYTYTVQAQDRSVNHNTNTPSPPAGATTDPVDIIPPPVPTFITPLGPVSATSIQVNANPVADGEGGGVEYRFHNTTLGTDSGWLSSPTWTNSGLTPETTYSYTVQARDTSPGRNESAASPPVSAATLAAPSAAVINLNFVGTTTFTTTVSPGHGLWGEGANTWNTTGLHSNGANQLVDSTGAATGVGYAYTTSSGGASRNSNAGWGPDALLQSGIFNSNDGTTQGFLTLTGLEANKAYELLVYHPPFNSSNRIETESANGVSPVNFTASATTTGGNTYNDAFDGVSANSSFWYYSGVTANGSGQIVITTSGAGHDVLAGFQIREVSGTASPYDNWSGAEAFDGDLNADGVTNGMAFLLGAANPQENATGLLPTVSESEGGLTLTFTCLAAADRGTALLSLEYDGDLAGTWLSVAVPGSVGDPNPIVEHTTSGSVSFVATDGGTNANGDALIHVVAAISDATESSAGRLFVRLRAGQP